MSLLSELRPIVSIYGLSGCIPPSVLADLVRICWKVHPALARALDRPGGPPSPEALQRLRMQLVDIVLAYGCSYRRARIIGLRGWNGIWPRARETLQIIILGCVRELLEFFEKEAKIDGFKVFHSMEELKSAARLFTDALIYGWCTCYRWTEAEAGRPTIGLPSTGRLTYNQITRLKRCLRQHRLVKWNPARISLIGFILTALRGSFGRPRGGVRPRFSMNAFVGSMLFPWVNREYGLTPVDVLSCVCSTPGCGCVNIIGSECRRCHVRPDFGSLDWRVLELTTQRWLIIPSFIGGAFYPAKWCRCAICRRIFPYRSRHYLRLFPRCHFCRAARNVKPMTIWLPRQGENYELNRDRGPEEGEAIVPIQLTVLPDTDSLLEIIDWEEELAGLSCPEARELAEHCRVTGDSPFARARGRYPKRVAVEVDKMLRRHFADSISL